MLVRAGPMESWQRQAETYGKTGSPQAHIKGTDTLVFVVDILGAFGAKV